jgi:hypothetical protein
LPCFTNSTARILTRGRWGLVVYAIYIPFYPISGHKVLNHNKALTNFYECVLYAKNHFKSHFTARAEKSAGKQGGF